MRRLQTTIKALLPPRSPKKGKLWSLGVVLLFGVVCFLLATGSIPSSAFAAGDTPSQQQGHQQSQQPLDVPAPGDCPVSAAGCANDAANQAANTTLTPTNSSIQNPIAANSTLMFFTDPAYTSGQPQVYQLWGIILGIVDCFIVLVLTLNGILIMLGGSVFRYSKAVEATPRILLALIATHLSMAFIILTLGLNNTLSKQLYDSLQKAHLSSTGITVKEQFVVTPGLTSHVDLAALAGSGFQCDDSYCWSPIDSNGSYVDADGSKKQIQISKDAKLYFEYKYAPNAEIVYYEQQPPSIQDCIDAVDPQTDLPAGYIVKNCSWPRFTITPQNIDFTKFDIPSMMKTVPGALDLMVDIMGLMLIAQVVIRIFFLDGYIVLAPMGIACSALPADIGRDVTSMWFKGFVSTVMVQFVQLTAIIVTQLILGSLLNALTGPGHITNAVLQSAILDKIVNVALLWFIFRIPAMFNTAPMRSMVEIGQTMAQTVSSFVSFQIAEYEMNLAMEYGLIEAGAGFAGMGIMSKL